MLRVAMLFAWFLLRDAFEGRRWRVIFSAAILVDLVMWGGSFAIIGYLAIHHQA